jgi:hypothetical protein
MSNSTPLSDDIVNNPIAALLAERERRRRKLANKGWSPHSPTIRQRIAIECQSKEILYGGAAGGGKSDWLLMEALRYVDIPGYAALILRRTYSDLSKPGALIDRAKQWLLSTPARWNEQRKQWTFPSNATITFGYLESENDKYQYQGSEFQCVLFDELTQFTETQYTYLFSRLRRLAGVEIPIRMRSATNPGGAGAQWVRKRFIPDDFEPEMAVEDRVFWKETEDSEGRKANRAFIPARIADNPYLDQHEYEETLSELDMVTREQLKRGDWSISEHGDIYWMFDPRYVFVSWSQWESVFKVRRIPEHWQLSIAQDQGTSEGHIGATGWFATAAENSPIPGLVAMYRPFQFVQMAPSEVADAMLVLMGDRKPQDSINKDLLPDWYAGKGERGRINRWISSHEAGSERLEYQKAGLPFVTWKAGPNVGIAQMRNYLTVINRDKPNPFNPDLMGHTRFVCIVPDSDEIRRQPDSPWARVEAEFYSYHYAKLRSGEESAEPKPYAFFNDYMDMIRCCAHKAFPSITELTESEQQEQALPTHAKIETIANVEDDQTRSQLLLARRAAVQKYEDDKRKKEYGWRKLS